MRGPLRLAVVLLGAIPASAAEEPSGCDKFKWPIERERAALTAPDRPKIASGDDLKPALPVAAIVSLRPAAEADLPTTPERSPAANTFSGFAIFKNALPSGRYTINLSAAGWIDVALDRQSLPSVPSSRVRVCRRS